MANANLPACSNDDELLLDNSDNNDITFNATLELPILHDTHYINFELYDYDLWPSDALYNVEPDNSVNQSTHTNCKYYSDRQFACNVCQIR